MSIGEFWRKAVYFFRRDRFDRDIEEEMRLHVELRARQAQDMGLAFPDAGHAAQRKFGNTALLQDESRSQWQWRPVEELRHDLRYTIRMLRRTPAFTTVAILSLALGIGANTAVFSLIDAVLWKTLPVKAPKQLRVLTWTGEIPLQQGYDGYINPDPATGIEVKGSFAYPVFRLFNETVPQFSGFAGFSNTEANVTVNGETEIARGLYVSGNHFEVLGVSTIAGRPILPEDDKIGKPAVAVISYSYWDRRFGLDPHTVGKQIAVNQKPVTVIGVLPKNFLGITLGRKTEIYLTMAFVAESEPNFYAFTKTDRSWVETVGRLRPGVSDEQAADALTAGLINWIRAAGGTLSPTKPAKVRLSPGVRGVEGLRSQVEPRLRIIAVLVGLVLLIACMNLANLLLARSAARRKEIAIRLSIGAGKFRLGRQLITESLLLAGMGGLAGLAIATPVANLVLQMVSGSDTVVLNAGFDVRTFGFALVLSLITGLIFGVVPAYRATRVDLTPALKNTGTTATSGLPALRLSRLLVAGQVALSVLLLVGAGLFVKTLVSLSSIDLGFSTDRLLTFRTDASQVGYRGERLADVYTRMREELAAIPGVQSVALSNHGLVTGRRRTDGVAVVGFVPKPGQDSGTHILLCSDSFLGTFGIPLIAGRDLLPRDGPGAALVAVVNEAFAANFFPNSNPLGQTFYFGDSSRPDSLSKPIEIVGIARNARYAQIRGDYPPTVYQPYRQVPKSLNRAVFAIRTALPPGSIAPAIKRAVAGIDSLLPVADLRTQQETVRRHIATERLFAGLVSSLGLLAAVLAAIGLYGVIAYTMMRRTSEIGIRVALGASVSQMKWLIVRDGVLMAAAGLAIGIPAAMALTKLVKTQLYGVEPNDMTTLVTAAVMMTFIAALAAYIPARRAAQVDPMVALKYE